MNSRKKRFWKLWQKRNEELAITNVEEANKIRYIKFLGKELPEYIQCFDHNKIQYESKRNNNKNTPSL